MKKRARWYSMAAALLLIVALWAVLGLRHDLGEGYAPFLPVAPEDLPNIPLRGLADPRSRAYLGVSATGDVALEDIPADVVLLEFMNVQCRACQRQAPALRKLYERIQDDPALARRVKVLSVAAGNNAAEADAFREQYRLPFPVHADPAFASYEGVGTTGGLPFLLVITLKPQGGGSKVATAHEGLVKDVDRLLEEVHRALAARWEDWRTRASLIHLGNWRSLTLTVSEDHLFRLLTEAAAQAGRTLTSVTPVEAAPGDLVYRLATAGGEPLWAKVAGRVKICNLCHDIYFIILFDGRGTVVNFTPIRVTKADNLPWDDRDNQHMRKRVVGRSLLGPVTFDPQLDAVSTATMSSALVVDTIRRLGDTYRNLAAKGLLAAAPPPPAH